MTWEFYFAIFIAKFEQGTDNSLNIAENGHGSVPYVCQSKITNWMSLVFLQSSVSTAITKQ